jgi:hypothetical protein
MENAPLDPAADDLIRYAFISVFAYNDKTIDADELTFIKQMALRDCDIDEQERDVLRDIFNRVGEADVTPEVWAEICEFRNDYGIS